MLVYVNVAVSVFGFAVQCSYWPGLTSVSSHPVVYLTDHRPANLPIQWTASLSYSDADNKCFYETYSPVARLYGVINQTMAVWKSLNF